MIDSTSKSWFYRLLPLVSALSVLFAILATDKLPEYILWLATLMAIALFVVWLASELSWTWVPRIFSRQSKITKEQKARLTVLLDDTKSCLSDSYTVSPFCTWHNISNKYHGHISKNYTHHWAISTWIQDLTEKSESGTLGDLVLANSMSKALSELTKLAECVEKDLERVFELSECDERSKKELRKQWDLSRTYFNQFMANWKQLLKEINVTADANCVVYFRQLEMVE